MKKNIIFFILVFVVIIITILFFYFKKIDNKKYNIPNQEVSLKLNWLHQAEFTGNYVAVEKGFYNDVGLKVNIIPFDFKSTVVESVMSGESQFGVIGADSLLSAREQGMPVVAIAVIYKTNPATMFSLKKSGIINPQDFIGKIVGIEKGSNTEYLYAAMMQRLNIDRSKIKEISIGYDAKEIIDGSVDVSTGYIINEPNLVKEAGYSVNTMLMSDYGVDVYSDVIFTTENLIKTDPDLVSRFLIATLNGWQYTIENEKEAVNIVLKYATDSTKTHQSNMLSDSIPLINTGKSSLGWMELSRWEQTYNILLEQKILSKEINIKDAFNMKFISDFYFNKKI